MPTSNAGPQGGFSLFPNTTQSSSKPPSRKTTPRPRAETPSSGRDEDPGQPLEMTPPRNGRRTPEDLHLAPYVIDGTPPPEGRLFPATATSAAPPPAVSPPLPLAEAPIRTDTAFSGAGTLVRSNSNRSRSSIAKRPLDEGLSHASPAAEAGLRSIFPQYDHSLPFDRQDYYPTQASPSHIPRTVISRQSHVPQQQSGESRSPVRSPLSAGSAQQRWPRRPHGPPVIPPVSTTEDLKEYWKTANGWKASAAEGCTYCMKLVPEQDTPVYQIMSATQPLYHLKINPTSASAYVTLSRHDPSKPFRERDPSADSRPGGILAVLREASDKNRTWAEAITTTLEEESRRLPPNDGLVALLYPSAATKMALERPGDIQAVMTAERECARLVWDEDSQNYFLVHPALATPFCVTVERNPAWSRTEYAIEHIDSPQHLARLTRDGTGEGWLEVDTLVAGRIDSFYLLDVAVCALLLVANLDEKNTRVEQFEPPPPSLQPPATAHLRDSFLSRMSGRSSDGGGGKKKKTRTTTRRDGKAGQGRLEELEMDLESQTSSLGKQLEVRDRDKLPSTTRTVIKLISFAFKCIIWALTLAFKALVAVVSGLSKCLTSEKL